PTPEAIAALLAEVLAHDVGEQFAVSEYELSARHDVRPLVLKTILTYLELDGLLAQGTPFYAGYSLRPLSGSLDDLAAGFDSGRAAFLRRIVESGKTSRVWTAVDPEAFGDERGRVIAALGYLEQQGLIELKASDVRQRYTLLARPGSVDELRRGLADRFERRERAETERIGRVVSLVTHDGCQVNALVGYFGETRSEPCGHCTFCLSGRRQALPEAQPFAPIESEVDVPGLEALREEHPGALGLPRQRARFLCGLTSPATTRAKLGRNALFGVLAERRFGDVLAWCE
ncbi:MAG: RecQ family zinc-binding domain-containing protein, partial [Gaiellaceae bacterium]